VPTGRLVAAGVLILAAIVVPLLVNTYADDKPQLWGFPFFFWYQLLWVFLASACTYGAYLLVERGRRAGPPDRSADGGPVHRRDAE
jgi:CHASE2 domain-containing sensor protein